MDFLRLVSGVKTVVSFITTSSGAGDADKAIATNGSGVIDATLLPPGLGTTTRSRVASEALSAGDFVNEWDDLGTLKARKADPTNGRPASGYIMASASLDANISVYPLGDVNSSLSGLTADTYYVLSNTTPGSVLTAVSATFTTGQFRQIVGRSLSATEMQTIFDEPIYF